MTEFPSAEDYIKAVQRPELAFARPDLAGARFDVHPMLGIPVPASGTTAVVFKATVGGTAQALRFFTREDASTRQRYTALNSWFTERGLAGDVAGCRWVDDAILVGGRRWPMVQMDWVDGRTLDQHVEDLVEDGDRASLEALAGSWRDLVRRAQAARFAHGDLQHGNVLVDTTGRLRLVDFDSSWIAPFAGSAPPSEGGHRNYQPANRVWGPWMDTFPGLVIYLSLLALAREPKQLGSLNDGESLLFRDQDYVPPHQTQAWTSVARLGDPQVDQVAARLRACCTPAWTATGDLETLLSAPAPWWTRTAATPQTATPQTATPQTAGPAAAASPSAGAATAREPGRPVPRSGPHPSPGPRATGQPQWWQQPSGPQPSGPQPSGPQPSGPQPSGPQPVPPTRPAPAGPRRPMRTAGRYLSAVVVAVLAWFVGFAVIAAMLAGSGELSDAEGAGIASLVGLVPASIFFVVMVRRRRP